MGTEALKIGTALRPAPGDRAVSFRTRALAHQGRGAAQAQHADDHGAQHPCGGQDHPAVISDLVILCM